MFTQEAIGRAILYVIALILSVTFHEYGHALVADRLGDGLPRREGRVTLNPLAHIDLIGTIVMPIVISLTGAPLLGWGKPVMTQPQNYTRKLRMKTGHMLVAAAGPAMNLLFAVIVSILLVVYLRLVPAGTSPAFVEGAVQLIQLNFILLFFNLIPLPPLDGGAVLRGLLPDRMGQLLAPLDVYGGMILLGLLVTGALGIIMSPVVKIISFWLGGVVSLAGVGA